MYSACYSQVEMSYLEEECTFKKKNPTNIGFFQICKTAEIWSDVCISATAWSCKMIFAKGLCNIDQRKRAIISRKTGRYTKKNVII